MIRLTWSTRGRTLIPTFWSACWSLSVTKRSSASCDSQVSTTYQPFSDGPATWESAPSGGRSPATSVRTWSYCAWVMPGASKITQMAIGCPPVCARLGQAAERMTPDATPAALSGPHWCWCRLPPLTYRGSCRHLPGALTVEATAPVTVEQAAAALDDALHNVDNAGAPECGALANMRDC